MGIQMNYGDVVFFMLLSLMTTTAIGLASRAGSHAERGLKNWATIMMVAAGLVQIGAIVLALHLGYRAWSI